MLLIPPSLSHILARLILVLVLIPFTQFAPIPPPVSSAQASSTQATSTAPAAFAAPEFAETWSRTDQFVGRQDNPRSWLWGPIPGNTLPETYAQGVDGTRLVQYFDKARMELNVSITDLSSPWRVTTGLLVAEMVEGRVQTGDQQFIRSSPSKEVLAGDDDVRENPRYSDFSKAASLKAKDRTDSVVTDTLKSNTTVLPSRLPFPHYGQFVTATSHNVPDVFWEYLNRSRAAQGEGVGPVDDRIFDWLYVAGYPVTEAYWADVKIGGERFSVLIQLFQRRTLTYVPAFPEAWQVQMGNVGQQYYHWRYGKSFDAQPLSSQPTPLLPADNGFVGVKGSSLIYGGQEIKVKGSNWWLHNEPFVSTWASWNGPQAQLELQKAKDLGVNTIRVGLPFDHENTKDVVWSDQKNLTEISPWIINEMTQLLQITSQYDMKVIFVLFEWYDDSPARGSYDEQSNIAYINGIVGPFAKDDRVLAWDIHNEPDNYTEWQGGKQNKVIEWLKRMTGYVREVDQQHPITIGVGDYKNLWYPASDGTTILSFIDVASFHCYDAGSLAKQIQEIKTHTNRPVLLEEMGWPTGAGNTAAPPAPNYDEVTQSFLYKTMLADSSEADIAGVAQWLLWDFKPRSTTGGKANSFQEHFGLVRTDGTLKPAADIFKTAYTAPPLPSTTISHVPLTSEGN